jgi:hypothetical protein
MKIWLEKRHVQFDEVIVINYNRENQEFYKEVFRTIDTSVVTKLTLYDMQVVDLSFVCETFTMLMQLKLYRPFVVLGNPLLGWQLALKVCNSNRPKTRVIPDIISNDNILLTIED